MYYPPPFIWWIAGGVLAIAAIAVPLIIWKRSKNPERKKITLADTLTIVAASIATGVSAQGMWRFAGDVLGLDGPWRVVLFAFIEVAIVTSAVRARKNVEENYSAGIDGKAVWALTALTAVLSSLDARSFAEAVFRLAAPLVAAWLWERGMANERMRISGLSKIHWRLTPERVMVRLGLAESSDRTASEVDAHRRITRIALAAKRARDLEATGARAWRQRRALTKLDRAVQHAVEHAGLAADHDRMRAMLDQIGAIYSAADLRDLPGIAPWAGLDHRIFNGPQQSETARLVEETQQLTEAILDRRDREASAAVESLAAYAQRRHVHEPGWDRTSPDAAEHSRTPTDAAGYDRTRDRLVAVPAATGRDRGVTARVDATTPNRWTRPTAGPDATDRPETSTNTSEQSGTLLDAAGQKLTPADGAGRDQATNPRPDATTTTGRDRPTLDDRTRVTNHWVTEAKAGHILSKNDLSDWCGFSGTWCLDRIRAGRAQLAAEGWSVDATGQWTRPDATNQATAR
jgi:hypothetical protein